MKNNHRNRKRTNLYTQGQQFAARVLFIVGLLGSGLGNVLAAPGSEEISTSVLAELNEEGLSAEAQKLLQYVSYLDQDSNSLIPRSLMVALLDIDQDQLTEVCNSVDASGLMNKICDDQDTMLGLTANAVPNSYKIDPTTVLPQLVKGLVRVLPKLSDIEVSVDTSWETEVKLYRPHADKVLKALKETSQVVPSQGIDTFLLIMGKYYYEKYEYEAAWDYYKYYFNKYKSMHEDEEATDASQSRVAAVEAFGNLGAQLQDKREEVLAILRQVAANGTKIKEFREAAEEALKKLQSPGSSASPNLGCVKSPKKSIKSFWKLAIRALGSDS